MKVEIIDHADRLDAVRCAWEELHARARQASVFNGWEWPCLWWHHYGQGQVLRVLVAWNGERMCGVLPLYVQRMSLLRVVPLRMLRNVGTGGDTAPDDLDVLLDPECEREAAKALALCLVHELRGWDVARLSDFPADSVFGAELEQAARAQGWRLRREVSARISLATLPAQWEDYLAQMSKDRRWTVRSTRRKFLALPQARFSVWQEASTLDRAIDRLIELHHLRWDDRGDHHAFSSKAYVGFHRELMHTLFARGQLRLYCLEVDGVVIAMLYCYRFRQGVYYFQGGFDPAMSRARPGLVLMGFAIESALQEGCKVFDMLRGEYDYKSQWAREVRETLLVELHPLGVASLAYRLRRHVFPKLKRSLSAWAGLARPAAPSAAGE